MSFDSLFQSPNPERNHFTISVFNLFSQEIVECWVQDSHSPFTDRGKGSLRKSGASRGIGLDLAVEYRKQVYGMLLRCDLEADKPLTNPAQIVQDTKSFKLLLDAAATPTKYTVLIDSKKHDLGGVILVWSSVDEKAVRAARRQYALADILSLEQIISDLIAWGNRDFQMLLDRRVAWSHDLFKALRKR